MNYCQKHGYYEASTVPGCPVCRTSDAPFVTAPASALGAPMQYPPFVPGGLLVTSGEGPTLRDLFAMAAMTALVGALATGATVAGEGKVGAAVASQAYSMADYMLAERAKRAQP